MWSGLNTSASHWSLSIKSMMHLTHLRAASYPFDFGPEPMPLCRAAEGRDESSSSSSLVRVTLMLGTAALTAGWDNALSSGSKSSWKPETRGFPRPSPSLRKKQKHEIKFKFKHIYFLNKCPCSFAVINASVLIVQFLFASFSLFLKILYFLHLLKKTKKHSEAEKSCWSEQMKNPICNPVQSAYELLKLLQ